MTEVTGVRPGGQFRPEDATTMEEFMARRDAELARLDGTAAHWGDAWRATVLLVVSGGCAFFWFRFSQTTGSTRWHDFRGALLFMSFVLASGSALATRLAGRSERRRELKRLTTQWQARVGQGETVDY
jgi:hypothetical protein